MALTFLAPIYVIYYLKIVKKVIKKSSGLMPIQYRKKNFMLKNTTCIQVSSYNIGSASAAVKKESEL